MKRDSSTSRLIEESKRIFRNYENGGKSRVIEIKKDEKEGKEILDRFTQNRKLNFTDQMKLNSFYPNVKNSIIEEISKNTFIPTRKRKREGKENKKDQSPTKMRKIQPETQPIQQNLQNQQSNLQNQVQPQFFRSNFTFSPPNNIFVSSIPLNQLSQSPSHFNFFFPLNFQNTNPQFNYSNSSNNNYSINNTLPPPQILNNLEKIENQKIEKKEIKEKIVINKSQKKNHSSQKNSQINENNTQKIHIYDENKNLIKEIIKPKKNMFTPQAPQKSKVFQEKIFQKEENKEEDEDEDEDEDFNDDEDGLLNSKKNFEKNEKEGKDRDVTVYFLPGRLKKKDTFLVKWKEMNFPTVATSPKVYRMLCVYKDQVFPENPPKIYWKFANGGENEEKLFKSTVVSQRGLSKCFENQSCMRLNFVLNVPKIKSRAIRKIIIIVKDGDNGNEIFRSNIVNLYSKKRPEESRFWGEDITISQKKKKKKNSQTFENHIDKKDIDSSNETNNINIYNNNSPINSDGNSPLITNIPLNSLNMDSFEDTGMNSNDSFLQSLSLINPNYNLE